MSRGRPKSANRDPSNGQYKSGSKRCFIATAVYGDFKAPEVIILRNWRDRVLSTNTLGRLAIEFYYRTSPPIARYLASHPRLSAHVRKLLNEFVNRIR